MAAPRRRAAWGTKDSLLEDLRLARDAGGIARSGADRLEASIRIRLGQSGLDGPHSPPTLTQLEEVRDWLKDYVARTCVEYRAHYRGDVYAQAAADSAEAILLAERGNRQTAASIRSAALKRHDCFIAVDSLRKRETPVLVAIAEAAYADVRGADDITYVSIESMLYALKPAADLAARSVADAADLYSKRAALHDDIFFTDAVQRALWAVAKFGVLPVYGLDRLRVLGIRDTPEQSIEYLLEGIIRVPFVAEPGDIYQLATATQAADTPATFYSRLMATPIMSPVVDRFVSWLGSHDPRVCLFDSNDVMIGYCRPHYYAALCECLAETPDDWASGAFHSEANGLLSALGLAQRQRE